MKIAIASDHRGIEFKKELYNYLKSRGYEVLDCSETNNETDDYPDYAFKVGMSIINKESDLGILICGTGIGMSIAANKIKGIYCARVVTESDAKLARTHNGANIIAIDSNNIELAKKIIAAFLETEALDDERHRRRYEKIIEIEKREYNGL